METQAINEQALFRAMGRKWYTARELVAALRAPESALRKIAQMLKTLEGVQELEGRTRLVEGQRRGRPFREFRRI